MKRVFRTTQQVTGFQKQFRAWKDYAIGDVVIGKILKETHKDKYDKFCLIIEVLDAQFKNGTGDTFVGKNLVINSSGQIAKAQERGDLYPGQLAQFTYMGTSLMEKGKFAGADAHVIEVAIVEESDSSEGALAGQDSSEGEEEQEQEDYSPEDDL